MSFNYAILGLLNTRSMTGYDLKKIIQKSSFLYWSGNNNQIYKGLLKLQTEGLVTSKTVHQEGSPSKKTYTITEKGRQELREWILHAPKEPPEFKKEFLIQFSCSGDLSIEELREQLKNYRESIEMKIIMERELLRRQKELPMRSEHESLLWEMIKENIIDSYQTELAWIRKTDKRLEERKDNK